jgi:gliding motility-associated-like protein
MAFLRYFARMRVEPWGMSSRFAIMNLVLALGLCGFSANVAAQLVNPGFESALSMPSAPGMWQLLPGWNNAFSGMSTPDFFHLDGELGGDLPETPIAWVQPAEGRGVAGITAIKRNSPGQPLSREYLVMEFDAPLQAGQHYTLSFQITNGEWLPTSGAGLAVNGLGVAFSVEQPIQMGDLELPLPPTFQSSFARYEQGWETVSFAFEASGPSRFMTIGVFGADADLEAEVVMGENPTMAYYFFDDFSLSLFDPIDGWLSDNQEVKGPEMAGLPVESEFYVPNAFSPNGDGVNDVFMPEIGDVNPLSCEIYSRWGELLARLDPASPQWDGRDMQGELLKPGVYVWRIEWPGSAAQGQEAQQGAVTVLR